MEYFELFLTFAKMGIMTFGGGYAMLPVLEREVVTDKGWATTDELLDYYAIGQCTPGIIAVNVATFIGRKKKGIPGGIISTLGIIFPSLIIISLLAGIIAGFSELEIVKNAFAGIRVCVLVLILNTFFKLAKKSLIDKAAVGIFIAVFICSIVFNVSPAFLVIFAGIAGIVIKNSQEKSLKLKKDPDDASEGEVRS